MPCDSQHNTDVEPGRDFTTPSPSLPAGHEPQTPEFLTEMIRELNALRQRDSELWADMYPLTKPGQVSKEPPYEKRERYRRESEEIQKKMASLKVRIQSLSILLVAQPPAKPELDKATPAQAPADQATRAEVLKGPGLPLQKPNEPFTPANVPVT